MIIREAIRKAQASLRHDDARFDAVCLAEKAFGLSKTELRLHGGRQIEPGEYFSLIERRAAGEPLQYILGTWEFYGLPFVVGSGVLIPRPETEQLVDIALAHLQGLENPIVYDLCAGSGCVGLSVAHHCLNAQVKLVELSDEALSYLQKNAQAYPNAQVIQADVLTCHLSPVTCQLILSNPPYIASSEIAGLSREVRREPHMALDGGTDGLEFYRALTEKWLPRLAPGGLLACECGEGQARKIAAMFAPLKTEVVKDFNGVERIVLARQIRASHAAM